MKLEEIKSEDLRRLIAVKSCKMDFNHVTEEDIQEIREIVQKEHIDCDFYENDAYLYTDDPQYVSLIQEIENILKSFRVETISDSQHLASIGLKHQAVFHPLKYLYQLFPLN